METLRWEKGTLYLLDQTVLPFTENYLACTTWQDVHKAISVLAVRGARPSASPRLMASS